MSNRHRTTLISFLAYFIMSGMLAPIGIVSGPMAEAFGLPVTDITARFSWLTMGIFVGAVLALFIFQWVRIRTLFLALYTVIGSSLLALLFVERLSLVGLSLGLVGVCCGMGLPAAALVISRSFDAERRASMLVITDGFFSVAGIVCAWVAVWFVAQAMHWAWTYLLVAGVAACVLILAYASEFPESEHYDEDAPPRTWPISAWLCIAALCAYTLAQNTILWWLPQYAQNVLGAAPVRAGNLVSQFWSGMFAAQLFVAWWVFKVGVHRLLWLGCISTFAFSLPLWILRDIDALLVLATLWGFANLGLLKVVLSYATQFTPVASGRLVSGLLLGATTGTAITPWVSSRIVAVGDAAWALRFGSLTYLVMIGLLAAAVAAYRSPRVTS